MIASLAMYNQPPLEAANTAFWALIRDGLRARGVDAPDALTIGEAAYWPAWQAQDLVLSHACGLPFRARLHRLVTLVGTPDYGLEGCPPGYYRSLYVVRADDPRTSVEDFDGASLAYNDVLSQSGWAAPVTDAAARGIAFGAGPCTGAHAASLEAVAAGEADIAAIDANTHAILTEHGLMPGRLRVIGATPPSPGTPYIAAAGADAEATFDAISEAIRALTPTDRTLLRLKGVVRIPAGDYLAVPNPPAP